jgi:hypothetical protein
MLLGFHALLLSSAALCSRLGSLKPLLSDAAVTPTFPALARADRGEVGELATWFAEPCPHPPRNDCRKKTVGIATSRTTTAGIWAKMKAPPRTRTWNLLISLFSIVVKRLNHWAKGAEFSRPLSVRLCESSSLRSVHISSKGPPKS